MAKTAQSRVAQAAGIADFVQTKELKLSDIACTASTTRSGFSGLKALGNPQSGVEEL